MALFAYNCVQSCLGHWPMHLFVFISLGTFFKRTFLDSFINSWVMCMYRLVLHILARTITFRTFISKGRDNPPINTLYSASLLMVENPRWMALTRRFPSGLIKTICTRVSSPLTAPSTCKFHQVSSSPELGSLNDRSNNFDTPPSSQTQSFLIFLRVLAIMMMPPELELYKDSNWRKNGACTLFIGNCKR